MERINFFWQATFSSLTAPPSARKVLHATVSMTRKWFMESGMQLLWFCTKSTCKAC